MTKKQKPKGTPILINIISLIGNYVSGSFHEKMRFLEYLGIPLSEETVSELRNRTGKRNGCVGNWFLPCSLRVGCNFWEIFVYYR